MLSKLSDATRSRLRACLFRFGSVFLQSSVEQTLENLIGARLEATPMAENNGVRVPR